MLRVPGWPLGLPGIHVIKCRPRALVRAHEITCIKFRLGACGRLGATKDVAPVDLKPSLHPGISTTTISPRKETV